MVRLLPVCIFVLVGWVIPPADGQHPDRPYRDIPTDKSYVALTFDDGPDAEMVPRLLDLFKDTDVKATFFVVGERVLAMPELTRRIAGEGHELGNHSFSHANLAEAESLEEVRREIVDTQNIITETTGITPVTFRAPYLVHDDRVWTVLKELDLPSVNAGKDPADWNRETTAEQILQRATENLQAGDVILLHSWRQETLDVMPEMIERIKTAGFEMVTLRTLLASRTEQPGSQQGQSEANVAPPENKP